MSTGTNIERITQNNTIIDDNNDDLIAFKNRIDNLPDTSTATATAGDIVLGKTAFVNGQKIEGTLEVETDWQMDSAYCLFYQNRNTDCYAELMKHTKNASDLYMMFGWNTTLASGDVNVEFNNVRVSAYGVFRNSAVANLVAKFTSVTDEPTISNNVNGSCICLNCPNLITADLTLSGRYSGVNSMFASCSNLTTVKLDVEDAGNTVDSLFGDCRNLRTVTGNIKTSTVTNFAKMFYNCSRLNYIPEFNMSSATNLNQMLYYCHSLNNDALNNLLQSLSTKSGGGTFASVFSESISTVSNYYPKSRMEALSAYQDFINAGWTLGY